MGERTLGIAFIRAFPIVLEEAREHLVSRRRAPAAEDVRGVLLCRFLRRFCEPFGLAALRKESGPSKMDLPRYHVRATGLLDKIFRRVDERG